MKAKQNCVNRKFKPVFILISHRLLLHLALVCTLETGFENRFITSLNCLFSMFFFNPNFYYISVILQVICVLHCMRKGNQNKWIWIIVFLPVVGCIAYLFTEVITNRDVRNVQSGLGEIINPSGSIRKLEANLQFADTFANRMALADAYLAAGFTDKAIDLYERSREGAFEENEHLIAQLIRAYDAKRQYNDIIVLAKKIYNIPQFRGSHAHILYAKALEAGSKHAEAEKEFKMMGGRFSNYEGRYEYGLFLLRTNRHEEGRRMFSDMLSEASHLSPREKRFYRVWFAKAKEELRKMQVVQ